MEDSSSYDVVIIGGGQAGIPLAYSLAGAGMSVALAEQENLGGSCVNYGCSPTKAAIASARVAHLARRAPEYGVRVPEVEVDFPAVIKRAADLAEGKRKGLEQGFAGVENPVLLNGHARFTGRDGERFRLDVGGRDVIAAQVVINTGAKTVVPPVEGLDGILFLRSENWLQKSELPERLAVIGGGYIGMEMSQFYRRMGSEVTVITGSSGRAVPHEDEEVSDAMQNILEEEGVRFVGGSHAVKVGEAADGLTLTLEDGREVSCSDVFVATGRRPNTDDLGLENIGLEASGSGVIEVNERLKTSVPGIWVAGDVRGGPMFTHTSFDDSRVLISQMTGDGSHTTDRVVPYAVFTDPELGRVGMTEGEAREAGREVEVMRFEMKNDGRSREDGETKGFIKVVADAASKEILGASVLASEGAELVHMYVDVMNAGAPYTVIRDAVHIHPTRAESIQSAVS